MTDPGLIAWFQAEIARILRVKPEDVTPERDLLDLGMDSLAAVQLAGALSEKVGYEVDPLVAYDHSTIAQIIEYLDKSHAQSR